MADLQPATMPDTSVLLPEVKLETLIANYRDVMGSTQDAEIQVQVMQRLAGLDMLRGESQLAAGNNAETALQLAIQAYRQLITDYPNRDDNDQLLYQLAKAYDLQGQSEYSLQTLTQLVQRYPHSVHCTEAEFRRAEIFFSRAEYSQAEKAYRAVLLTGEQSDYYQNSLYMTGWSQFKTDRYESAVISFSKMLDLMVPEDNQIDKLPRASAELLDDTLRVMSVSFSYLGGPASVVDIFEHELGPRHYLPLLFDRLGQLYLKRERFGDSAESYRAFVQAYPDAIEAPAFYAKLIKVYETGQFAEQVLAEKETYVQRYGINSDYWQSGTETMQAQIRPYLKQYLQELAQYNHALAQSFVKQQKNPAKTNKSAQQLANSAQKHFVQAGDYYQQFVNAFPNDERVAETIFLLAESRLEAGRYIQAIEAFETVAYQYSDYKRAADAGYAAVLVYQQLMEQAQAGSEAEKRKKIDSAQRFAEYFQGDSRAPLVLAQTAEELLGLEDYQQAVTVATRLTQWPTQLPYELQRTAWLVVGHSEFELQQFVAAEAAYQNALVLTRDKSQRTALTEQLAASIYKQAELLSTREETLAAAEQFLRAVQVAPQSSFATNAHYDAAINFMAAEDWSRAITQLNELRLKYPEHTLTEGIASQLVVAYQETAQWQLAAEELYAIYQHETDKEAKRQALYLSAELHEKAGDKATAIVRYRSYAHTYAEPFKQVMEARYRLSELYRETGEAGKRRFWLRKIIAGQSAAKGTSSERTLYLAALSQSVLADDEYKIFQPLKLTSPLKKSLKKKTTALGKTLKAYQKTIDYGVQEFSTMGTFRIGEVYADLSRSLLNAKPPKNLDALALEQYQLLLEEQAYPFEEKAISIHEANARRSWSGVYDDWVKRSFTALGQLLPARYRKQELRIEVSDEIY